VEILTGEGFRLRRWKTEDAVSLARHANNRNISRFLRDGFPYPYTLRDAESWIEMILKADSNLVYAIEVNNEACGGIGLHALKDVYRFNAELGYWLSEQHWGRGIMTEAIRLLTDHAFRNHHWERIFAGVFSNNQSSMRVLEKCGFKKEAVHYGAVNKENQFLDEVVYALLKSNWKKLRQEVG